MTRRIASIGRRGQMAQALAAAAAASGVDIVQAGSDIADLRDAQGLERFILSAKPDAVINAGAFNFVDRAQTEAQTAFAVNADGPRELARLCRQTGAAFIHMSTDCVFDGAGSAPHAEDEEPRPLSVYGASKLAGERAVAEEYPEAVTVRVAWVFSEFGDNFVSKIIELARTRPSLRVVCDQIGPPTYAPDIANALLRAAQRMIDKDPPPVLLHIASPDAMSRSDMARAILEESRRQGGPWATVEPVTSAMFNAAAPRPLNARLSNALAVRTLDLTFTPWTEALKKSVAGVLARA